MRIFGQEQRVLLNVGTFARFHHGSMNSGGGGMGNWRALAGTRWHQWLQHKAGDEGTEAEFEYALNGCMLHAGWTFELSGRVDQVLKSTARVVLREVKTVTRALPVAETDLRQEYPDYFRQISAYLSLAAASGHWPDHILAGELLFYDLNEGVAQTVRITAEEAAHVFADQAERMIGFLNERRRSDERRRQLAVQDPFPSPRPGQEHILRQLKEACLQSNRICWQAPTGFGKTRAVLAYGLAAMRDGLFDRIIYLSGKSTGQIQVMSELRSLSPDGGGLWSLQLRSRSEHAGHCRKPHCDGWRSCREQHEGETEFLADACFQPGECNAESIRRYAAAEWACPNQVTRRALPYADIWVGDYNYVFSPRHRTVLESVAGYYPASTLLLVDEAHNVADRVRDNMGFQERAAGLRGLTLAWQQAGAGPAFLDTWECWSEFIEHIPASREHDSTLALEAADLIERLLAAAVRQPVNWDHLSAAAADYWFSLDWKRKQLQSSSHSTLLWSAAPAELRFACLDPSQEIAAALAPYGQVVLFSATLDPVEDLTAELGMQPGQCPSVHSHAPWRDEAYKVAVDCRVDTRLSRRSRHYGDTADTLIRVCRSVTDPVAVFFPSYPYAETIRTYLSNLDPSLTVVMQPRAVGLDGQMQFLNEGLLCAHALFFVLGSGFSESIDILGGKTGAAVVIGPALPEVNPFREALRSRWEHLPRGEAFRRAYQIPAMRKINQALGRLVRAPEQQAKVLLHCRRFAEPSYRSLLSSEYQHMSNIQNDADLTNWLAADSFPGKRRELSPDEL